MKTLNTLILVLIVLSSIFATFATAGEVKPYAFGLVSAPDADNDQYRFEWMRVGANYFPELFELPGSFMFRTEFNLSKTSFENSLKYAYMMYSYESEIGTFSGTFGQWLHALQYKWDGPKGIRHILWPRAEYLPCYGRGLQLSYSGDFDLYIENSNEGDEGTKWSGMIDVAGTGVYFVEGYGWGAVNRTEFASWLNIGIGFTVFEKEDDAAFYEWHGDFDHLRFTVLADHNIDSDELDWSVSADYQYAPYSSVRIGLDQRRSDSGENHWVFVSGVAFSY